jgi:hypothetical protein
VAGWEIILSCRWQILRSVNIANTPLKRRNPPAMGQTTSNDLEDRLTALAENLNHMLFG